MNAAGTSAEPWAAEALDLVRPRPPLELPVPDYGGRCVVNLSASLHRACGGELDGEVPLAPALSGALDPFDGRRSEGTALLFLVDGLGWAPLRRWTGSERGRRWNRSARPITTTFPSTTTTALTSLSTAVPPGRHGLVGYRQYLPRYGVVADLLKMTPIGVPVPDLLIGSEWRPSDLSGAPTLFRRGLRASILTRDRFHGTGFTRLLYDGADFVGYATATDLAHELVGLLDREHPPAAVFLYWDELDTIQHLKGPSSALFEFEMERVAHLLEFVAAHLPEGRARSVQVLVTGDHGQVAATPAARVAVDQEPAIVKELARPLAGDRRAGLFQARPGRREPLRAALEARLPTGSRVVEAEAAVEAGLFGPPPFHPELLDRLGDFLALVPSPAALTYQVPGQPTPKRFLVGSHGGAEPDELLVPLVAAPLSELGAPLEPTKR